MKIHHFLGSVINKLRLIFLVISSASLMILFDVALKLFGFRWVTQRVNALGLAVLRLRGLQRRPREAIGQVSRAVELGRSFHWKGRTDCLPRALATFSLLSIRGVTSNFLIGVTQFPFGAHSWVESNGRPVQENEKRIAQYVPVWRMGYEATSDGRVQLTTNLKRNL
jgi:hypothetical protein